MRTAICILAVVVYLVWVAMYLVPYAQDAALSDATLRRIVHTAVFY